MSYPKLISYFKLWAWKSIESPIVYSGRKWWLFVLFDIVLGRSEGFNEADEGICCNFHMYNVYWWAGFLAMCWPWCCESRIFDDPPYYSVCSVDYDTELCCLLVNFINRQNDKQLDVFSFCLLFCLFDNGAIDRGCWNCDIEKINVWMKCSFEICWMKNTSGLNNLMVL